MIIKTNAYNNARNCHLDAELKKIPYMLIVGEKEENEGTVSVRKHGEGDLGTFEIADFAKLINDEVEELLRVK